MFESSEASGGDCVRSCSVPVSWAVTNYDVHPNCATGVLFMWVNFSVIVFLRK